MSQDRSPAGQAAHPDIVSTRVVEASREAVFAAFSDPSRLAQWWGPQGFSNTFHHFDFRPGGVWRFTMRGPDGAAYEMNHQFVEIRRPEQIVVRHIQEKHDFVLTMTLDEQGPRTAVTWRMCFDDPAEGQKVRSFVVPANEQNLDRLAAHLSASSGFIR